MNHSKILIIIMISFVFSTTIDLQVNVIPNEEDTIYQTKINFNINSKLNIYALRFNVGYDNSKIKLNKNQLKFNDDVKIYFNENDSDLTEILVIGDIGDVLMKATSDSLVSFMELDFFPINDYEGNISVDINEFKMFGFSGIDLNHNLPSKSSLQLSFFRSLQNILYSNEPNPFRYITNIKYELSDTTQAYLIVRDFNGSIIDTLINKIHYPDKYKLSWYAMGENNNPLPSGNYILSLDTENYSNKIKMVILR